jgi:hypothetical protein
MHKLFIHLFDLKSYEDYTMLLSVLLFRWPAYFVCVCGGGGGIKSSEELEKVIRGG